MNRVKYIIHRSKEPFRNEKAVLLRLVDYFKQRWTDIEVLDKGLRFSLLTPTAQLDFDFGFHNMRYRDFSSYSCVIAQGTCAALKPEAQPGDVLVPSESAVLRVNTDASKVRVYDDKTRVDNGFEGLWDQLRVYEEQVDTSRLRDFICAEFPSQQEKAVTGLGDLNVHRQGRFIEANRVFDSEHLQGARAILKDGEDKREIPHLQKYLEKGFDAVDREAKQMMDNVGHKLCMFHVATNKPYAGIPLTDEIRHAADPGRLLPSYHRHKIIYLQALILAYLLHHNFKT